MIDWKNTIPQRGKVIYRRLGKENISSLIITNLTDRYDNPKAEILAIGSPQKLSDGTTLGIDYKPGDIALISVVNDREPLDEINYPGIYIGNQEYIDGIYGE